MTALGDANILVAAHRADHPHHGRRRDLLHGPLRRGFARCAHTRTGFLRLMAHPRVFALPTPMPVAAWDALTGRSASERLPDTARSDARVAHLCRDLGAVGNAVSDLHLAAWALAHDREAVSPDAGFGRIPGVRGTGW